ncbi:MAG: SMR family transporter [Cyanobacteria bacterium P01_F01_bin.86]
MSKFWLLLIIAATLNAVANLLLKKSTLVGDGLEQYFSPFFIAGLALFGLNVVIYAKALQGIPVAVGYPVLVALGFIIVVLGANVWFMEQLTTMKIVGIMVILLGIGMVTSSN